VKRDLFDVPENLEPAPEVGSRRALDDLPDVHDLAVVAVLWLAKVIASCSLARKKAIT
jgi:hypothetical protein